MLLGNLYCCSSIHLTVPFFDIYLLDEDALMNWFLKVFMMHKFRGRTCLVEILIGYCVMISCLIFFGIGYTKSYMLFDKKVMLRPMM